MSFMDETVHFDADLRDEKLTNESEKEPGMTIQQQNLRHLEILPKNPVFFMKVRLETLLGS
jgi:hypothetical protein